MIYLVGASGHAKVIIEILEELDVTVGALQDANPEIKSLIDHDVFQEFPESFDATNDSLIISIGNNTTRKKVASSFDYRFFTAIHPNANISKRASIGEGSVVMAGVSINSGVTIGKHAIVNTNASIDHDCFLDDYVHISPNAALAGDVKVGEGTHIGIGACVIQGVTIGKWCTIGAGAVIIKDVPNGSTVVGNPGHVIKIIST